MLRAKKEVDARTEGGEQPKSKKRGAKVFVALALAVSLGVGYATLSGGGKQAVLMPCQVAKAERRDLSVKVSGSATLAPADSYNVTTLLSGTIQSAPFEEGDLVEKGTLLYTMDSGDAKSNVDRAHISVEQARLAYEQAEEALRPTASLSGIISEVYVHNGQAVTAGEALARIVASSELTIDFLFTYVSPDQFYVGQSATVFVSGFDGPVQGTVASVSSGTSVTSNGRESCTVRVKVSDPGVVTDAFTASAVIGSYQSYGSAPITMAASATVYAAGSGTVNGFSKLAGSTVTKGETLCTVESEANRSQLENARLNVASAQLSAGTAAGNLDDYNIKSPISGTIIEKNCKAGDKVDGASSGNLAVVYDLSCLKMKMNVNELDIGKVKEGQQVEITAAALPGKTFLGTVEKVSINGTTANGFTTYPVTISVKDYGDLKPGMNVSTVILCETAKDVLCVPVSAVVRGGTVKVPGPGAVTEDGSAIADASKLEERTVTLGRSDEMYTEILTGLQEGEPVLVTGDMGA